MAFTRFFNDSISQTASNASYAGVFESSTSSSGLPGWQNLSSLSAEGAEIVTWIRYKLGEPVLYCELDNKQIFAAFEEANIKYSALINTFQIRNWMTNMYGLSKNFNTNDLTNKLPFNTYNFLKRQVKTVAAETGKYIGGVQNTRKAYILMDTTSQNYNMYNFVDEQSGSSISEYLGSVSGTTNTIDIEIKNIFHYSPITLYRFYDPYSSVNLLSQEFNFESFNTETIFYVLPIWNDILRAQMLNLNDKVRRSNISYQRIGDNIRIFPKPLRSMKLWIEYTTANSNPFSPNGSLSGDPSISGISNISNVPFKDVKYEDLNPLSRNWIRQFTFALSLEALGRIRRKFRTVPIPNGDISLDGDELVREGIERQDNLERQMREDMEKLTNTELLRAEAEQMDILNRQLQRFPNEIFVM